MKAKIKLGTSTVTRPAPRAGEGVGGKEDMVPQNADNIITFNGVDCEK
ncbi:hypothetical protein MUU47_08930 [Scandinavium sp. H11S7]|uniref:Uncharacterized protein n=1 Tax=Scandinavium hiltneri TaxID=2926519 RepID=A0ABT2E046_9ENTR|nr:hypothetical protein [Scandinavium hiltneri]MCS2161244.1 hypothetical protein [Scandinavium hiltneri]